MQYDNSAGWWVGAMNNGVDMDGLTPLPGLLVCLREKTNHFVTYHFAVESVFSLDRNVRANADILHLVYIVCISSMHGGAK